MHKYRNNSSRFFVWLWLSLLMTRGMTASLASAQGQVESFPGQVIEAGSLDGLNPEYELIYLPSGLILGQDTAAGQYRVWQDALPQLTETEPRLHAQGGEGQRLEAGYQVTSLSNSAVMAWRPDTGQYRVYANQAADSGGGLLSAQPLLEGTLEPSTAERQLIYVGYDRILEWEPATGNYRYWQYDPSLRGNLNAFPGQLLSEGNWPTIRSGHELVYLGYRRILDWEPASGHYRIWAYDPMRLANNHLLSDAPVVEGDWGPSRVDHQLLSLGDNRLLDWNSVTSDYQIWQFSMNSIGTFSAADISRNLADQSITGVTVVTHGFQASDSEGDALIAVAEDIHNRAGGWLINHTVDGNGNSFIESCTNNCQAPEPQLRDLHEAVFLFDWASGANEASTGWAEAAADGLFGLMIELSLVEPTADDNPPYHFIGHSFGTAVTSEAIEHLAYFDIPVGQVTYLDPHDFNQGFGFDGAQALGVLGQPPGYGVTVWRNVAFADVYYQTRGEAGGVGLPPNGRPIPGAYNRHLLSELPNPNDYTFDNLAGDHNFVQNCFYRATIRRSLPPDCAEPQAPVDYANTGYAFSRIEVRAARPAPNFYGAGQDHQYSEDALVNPATGAPNLAGLADLGLTPEDVIRGRWLSRWLPFDPVNGDFEDYTTVRVENLVPLPCLSVAGENLCPQPGWSYYEGGGTAHFDQANNNAYMVLDWDNTYRHHNGFYIPPNTTTLRFDLRRVDGPLSTPDLLRVRVGPQSLATYQLSEDDADEDPDFVTRQVSLPAAVVGQVVTLTFEYATAIQLENGSTAWIDNVTLFAPQDIQVRTGDNKIINAGGAVDVGSTAMSQPLSRTFTVKNMGRAPLTLAKLSAVPAGFSIRQDVADTTLSAGETTTFSLQLDATAVGVYSGVVRLVSNDPDENPFEFTIRGTVTQPAYQLYLPLMFR